MPEYAGLFQKMPVNACGMDFIHKCRHFPNPAPCTGQCRFAFTYLLGYELGFWQQFDLRMLMQCWANNWALSREKSISPLFIEPQRHDAI